MPSSGTQGTLGTRKGRGTFGFGGPQVDDRGADQDEGEERADAHELAQDIDRRHGSDNRDQAADDGWLM